MNSTDAAVADAGRLIHLDKGEQAALALWHTHQDAIMLCYDLQARMVVHHFGIPVMGTIGLILRTAHLSLRPISEVRRILNELPTRSMRKTSRFFGLSSCNSAIFSCDNNKSVSPLKSPR